MKTDLMPLLKVKVSDHAVKLAAQGIPYPPIMSGGWNLLPIVYKQTLAINSFPGECRANLVTTACFRQWFWIPLK